MWIVAVAWTYVVLMMALAEAVSANGTVLGAVFTFVLYGVLPLGLLLYILATLARKRARALRESAVAQPDRGSHAAADAVAPEREEP